ncbi:hypothetical protein [Pseudaminobacter soli (ex Li et al. 2025)]|nr:hypothetical protein [Mesorhizobium soli]
MGNTFKTDLMLFSAAFIAAAIVLCANIDLSVVVSAIARVLP